MIVTAKEFRAFLNGQDSSEEQEIIINIVIPAAQKFLEKHCRRSFEFGEYTDYYTGIHGDLLVFNQYPVVEVTSLSISGSDQNIDKYKFIKNESGENYKLSGKFGNSTIIHYKAGYQDVIPEDLKLACLILASHFYIKWQRSSFGYEQKSEHGVSEVMHDMPPEVVSLISGYRRVI